MRSCKAYTHLFGEGAHLQYPRQDLHLQSCAGADIKDLTVLDQQPPEGYISTPAQVRPPTPLSKLSHDFLLQ